jgi:hypothetical protein
VNFRVLVILWLKKAFRSGLNIGTLEPWNFGTWKAWNIGTLEPVFLIYE